MFIKVLKDQLKLTRVIDTVAENIILMNEYLKENIQQQKQSVQNVQVIAQCDMGSHSVLFGNECKYKSNYQNVNG